jgi:hypothetical protein
MGLLDRFKSQPRWKHADAAVRLEAVRDLEEGIDMEALAETDPDVKVRRAAIAHVSSPACLGRASSNDPDPDTRERAADRLLALACDPPGPPAAAEGAGETPESRADGVELALAAVEALTDGRRLSTVAKSEAPDAVRAAALARVTDVRALGSIARHARVEATAAAALARLEDRGELLEVAVRGEHRDVSLAAFDRFASAPLEIGELRSIKFARSRRPSAAGPAP